MGASPDFLPYLKLFHDESPRNVLGQFYTLLENQPEITVTERPDRLENVLPKDFLKFESECEDQWKEFVGWWIDQYQREIVRKYDSLTGLYNRSYWNRRLCNRFRTNETNYSVILVDVDHFKHFNDEYGHSVGDEVLEAVGDVLREAFLPDGTCVRYGGEEFLVLLTDSPENVMKRADEFRESVGGKLYEGQPEDITVSLGVSLPDGEHSSLEERIEEADLALYASKRRGRNQTTDYLPYMRHRESLSVWGFYRYFWGSELGFTFGQGPREFFVYYEGTLRRYRWNKNQSRRCELPDAVESIRTLQFSGGRLVLLDETGRLWIRGETKWRPVKQEDAPAFTSLFGSNEKLYVSGVNNQLYRVDVDSMDRVGSLPDRWERTVYCDEPLLVSGGTLRTPDDPPERWALPEGYVDFAGGDGKLVMSSTGGNLYVFNRELDHWTELTLPDFLNDPVQARRIERSGDELLIHDDNGRFFLASRSCKSVPQQMNLGFNATNDRQ
jgi:diguanylate cyclase (GGDEF)-like protein